MGNLASVVDELLAADPRELPCVALGEEIEELYRQASRLQAAILDRVEAFDRTGGAKATPHETTAAWLRAKTRLSPTVASRDVHLARDLADVLPATRAALRDGAINPTQAQQIASLRNAIGDDALRSAEPHLVDYATRVSAKELTAAITHVKHMYGRERQDSDEQDDYASRKVHSSTTIGGMGVGQWLLHPAGQEIVQTAIHALSKPIPGDDRTPAQRRAERAGHDGRAGDALRAAADHRRRQTPRHRHPACRDIDRRSRLTGRGLLIRRHHQRRVGATVRLRRRRLPDRDGAGVGAPRRRPHHPHLHRRAIARDRRP
jgi:hypothetical protein